MPNFVIDLQVDRVDLVDEGSNSEAYIKMYKRKEVNAMNLTEVLAKMAAEDAAIITAELAKAKAEVPATTASELAEKAAKITEMETANATLTEDLKKSKETPKAEPSFEDVVKGLAPEVQEVFKSIKAQKDAAEFAVKELNALKVTEEAVSKARELKAIPVEEATLVAVMKSASPELFEVLKKANAAIEGGELLVEKGKGSKTGSDTAWEKIEKMASDLAKAENITNPQAITRVMKANPELYDQYLKGGN